MDPRNLAILYGLFILADPPAVGRQAWAQVHVASSPATKLVRIRPSQDKTHFVREGTNERIEMWGFNCSKLGSPAGYVVRTGLRLR
jgi:hypothetical protein